MCPAYKVHQPGQERDAVSVFCFHIGSPKLLNGSGLVHLVLGSPQFAEQI
jgi:hypothetical protein